MKRIIELAGGTLAALALWVPTVRADAADVVAAYTAELGQITRVAVADSTQYTDRALRLMTELDAQGAPSAAILRVGMEARRWIELRAMRAVSQIRAKGHEATQLLERMGAPREMIHRFQVVVAKFEAQVMGSASSDIRRIEAAMRRVI